MKRGSAHSSSLIHRWLSGKSSTVATPFEDDSDELRSNNVSPPPLTDSSSMTASASTVLTPTTSFTQSLPCSTYRIVPGKTPCQPPIGDVKLPVVPINNKHSVSSVERHSSALVARPASDIKLHRVLNHDPRRSPLIFDVSLPLSFIRQYPPSPPPSMSVVVRKHPPAIQPIQPSHITGPNPISEQDLSQFATTPPVTRIRISCDLLPWIIDVRGRTTLPNDPRSFVRVVDILDGIYTCLRTKVTSREWNHTEQTFREQVKKAYSRRCHTSRPFTLTGYEEKQGVRRVDYLQDKKMFLGLTMKSPAGGGSDRTQRSDVEVNAWAMIVAPSPNS